MVNTRKASEEKIGKLESEIEKLTLLSNRMKEALRGPYLNVVVKDKYNTAIKGFEKKIKMLKGDIKAVQILESLDFDRIEIPRHYQHHSK